MNALFITFGLMVLLLLGLLLWFVPHLLHQQASRVANETAQLREMLLDLLSEQESVAVRQSQLSASMGQLQGRIESIAQIGESATNALSPEAASSLALLESRLTDLQTQTQAWFESRQRGAHTRELHDSESWGNLMGLLASIQERIGTLSRDRSTAAAAIQAGQLLEDLEREMQNLRTISDDIARLQQRLNRSLGERDTMAHSTMRQRVTTHQGA